MKRFFPEGKEAISKKEYISVWTAEDTVETKILSSSG